MEECDALRAEVARLTAERDALRGLATNERAVEAACVEEYGAFEERDRACMTRVLQAAIDAVSKEG